MQTAYLTGIQNPKAGHAWSKYQNLRSCNKTKDYMIYLMLRRRKTPEAEGIFDHAIGQKDMTERETNPVSTDIAA